MLKYRGTSLEINIKFNEETQIRTTIDEQLKMHLKWID